MWTESEMSYVPVKLCFFSGFNFVSFNMHIRVMLHSAQPLSMFVWSAWNEMIGSTYGMWCFKTANISSEPDIEWQTEINLLNRYIEVNLLLSYMRRILFVARFCCCWQCFQLTHGLAIEIGKNRNVIVVCDVNDDRCALCVIFIRFMWCSLSLSLWSTPRLQSYFFLFFLYFLFSAIFRILCQCRWLCV